ncbi:hypothetical protein PC121_g16993 [Phytophthora cactorum]|nr:hypothetical protein PC121_g16993 [Phytophthora cactorum]
MGVAVTQVETEGQSWVLLTEMLAQTEVALLGPAAVEALPSATAVSRAACAAAASLSSTSRFFWQRTSAWAAALFFLFAMRVLERTRESGESLAVGAGGADVEPLPTRPTLWRQLAATQRTEGAGPRAPLRPPEA